MDWTRTIVAGVLLAGGAAAQEAKHSSDASSSKKCTCKHASAEDSAKKSSKMKSVSIARDANGKKSSAKRVIQDGKVIEESGDLGDLEGMIQGALEQALRGLDVGKIDLRGLGELGELRDLGELGELRELDVDFDVDVDVGEPKVFTKTFTKVLKDGKFVEESGDLDLSALEDLAGSAGVELDTTAIESLVRDLVDDAISGRLAPGDEIRRDRKIGDADAKVRGRVLSGDEAMREIERLAPELRREIDRALEDVKARTAPRRAEPPRKADAPRRVERNRSTKPPRSL